MQILPLSCSITNILAYVAITAQTPKNGAKLPPLASLISLIPPTSRVPSTFTKPQLSKFPCMLPSVFSYHIPISVATTKP